MFTFKRTAAAVLTAGLVAGMVAGCGGEPKKETPAPAATPAASDAPVTITFARGKDSTGATQALIDAFQAKNKNITVKFEELPGNAGQQRDKYVTGLTAGALPIDVLALDVTWTAEFAASDWILPLDDMFAKQKDQFLPGPLAAVTYNGKIYAAPWYTDGGVLYYRKDLVEKAPETFEDLVKMAKAGKEKGGIENGIVFQADQFDGLICNFLEYAWGAGADTSSKVVVNSPEAVKGLQFMMDMINDGTAPKGVTTYKEEDARQIFQEGKAVFMRNWPYAYSSSQKEGSKVIGKVGLAPMPHAAGKTSAATLGGFNLAVNKSTKVKDAALKFVEFATSVEGQKIYAINASRLPTRKAVYDDADVLKAAPQFKEIRPAVENGKPRPVTPFYAKISDAMQVEIHKALTGGKTAQQALDAAQKQINEILGQ
jgi:multiple sugar transport system substrate-binding protein